MAKSSTKRWVTLVCVVGVPLSAWAAVFLFNNVEAGRWKRFRETIRDEPLTFGAIEARRATMSDGPTLAGVILQHRQELSARTGLPQLDLLAGFEHSAVKSVRAFRDEHANLIQQLRNTRPEGRFELKSTPAQSPPSPPPDPQLLLDRYMTVRRAAQLLHTDYKVELITGSRPSLDDHITELLDVADVLATEPLLLAALVHHGLVESAAVAAEQTLWVEQVSEPELVSAGDQLAAAAEALTLEWGFMGERAMVMGILRDVAGEPQLESTEAYAPLAPATALNWLPRGFVLSNQTHCCRLLTRLVQASRQRTTLRDTAHAVAREVAQLPATHMFSRMLLPGLGGPVDRHLQTVARVHATVVALAAERYRMQHGEFPEDLSVLVPDMLSAVPVDPFDGAALRSTVSAEGFVVYSIGPDGLDDGGQIYDADDEHRRSPDVGCALRAAAERRYDFHAP